MRLNTQTHYMYMYTVLQKVVQSLNLIWKFHDSNPDKAWHFIILYEFHIPLTTLKNRTKNIFHYCPLRPHVKNII